jgi:hypothetical protein
MLLAWRDTIALAAILSRGNTPPLIVRPYSGNASLRRRFDLLFR